jgi:hypothetical protein
VDLLRDLSPLTANRIVERFGRRSDRATSWSPRSTGAATGDTRCRGPTCASRIGSSTGGVDIVHGHSSHHPRPVEVYRDTLVLYGCGDLIDDYEGIGGYEDFRSELVLLYFPEVESAAPTPRRRRARRPAGPVRGTPACPW